MKWKPRSILSNFEMKCKAPSLVCAIGNALRDLVSPSSKLKIFFQFPD